MVVVRSLAFNILFYIATAVIALVGLPVLVSQKATLRYAQFWGHVSIWLLRVVAGTRVDFRGIDALPKGPLVIAAKHQSTLETLALTIPFEKFTYVLKRELMWIPLFGWYLGRSGMVPIDRAKGARTMAKLNEAAAQAIREGRQLIIFPEGTRRAAGAPSAYKQGLSHLYVALGVPCVPVALNSGLYWRRHSFWRLPGTCVIEFLPPIPHGLGRPEFLAEVQARIETASNALLVEGRADLAEQGLPAPVFDGTGQGSGAV
ncbi:lysophospholipid acyltransferase family protein [Methylobacterium haplocladii]|uniref:1-acyl-sn-glycerol-3-phosphate acyltransferase n=1 Tax=Methylobacterium haplocladii TaxID=1176176 RepID=A0A512IUR7_9HYPH|nr:lysophospholipid acyltransferase family protein [Methylobacterium haplocladii]GEP01458.1 1-acyl-sn-glycerol-3-phosphate acyltransferase [Methylobacterium haplocladii]GJD85001.1 hypothetical protein HPGCJGGD_2886 [Methylobacterium haplocladii]GLS58876.1 1-acyl-sn-glycerol-3-phosphate acyltransferase [Methylobacterium haplocladii]